MKVSTSLWSKRGPMCRLLRKTCNSNGDVSIHRINCTLSCFDHPLGTVLHCEFVLWHCVWTIFKLSWLENCTFDIFISYFQTIIINNCKCRPIDMSDSRAISAIARYTCTWNISFLGVLMGTCYCTNTRILFLEGERGGHRYKKRKR